jgi:hypothetical protein
MRVIFLSLCFLCLFLPTCVYAQLNVSTSYRTEGVWDDEKDEWKVTWEGEDFTFFEFNKDMSMFKHITNSVTSAYMIKKSSKDEENNRIEFDVVSDVGNEYLMILDTENDNIRFIFKRDGVSRVVQHKIKNAWTKEE